MARYLFIVAAIAVLHPAVTSAMALVLGIVLALAFGNPYQKLTRAWTSRLLQYSVVALGAGMDLRVVAKAGAEGLAYTAIGITLTLALGSLLGRLLKTDTDTSVLVSSGTAICGGSAIAAVASTLGSRPASVSVALATVFLLNSAALVLFPWIGHGVGLDQHQFGLWSALAIHDTSSVVGAAMQYGASALEIATTVKLARALWIVPVAFAIGALRRRSGAAQAAGKAKKPWFILGFLIAAAVFTFIPALAPVGVWVSAAAKRGLVFTLFLIGSGISRETLKEVGVRPLLQGLLLWAVVASSTLGAILEGWIH